MISHQELTIDLLVGTNAAPTLLCITELGSPIVVLLASVVLGI